MISQPNSRYNISTSSGCWS